MREEEQDKFLGEDVLEVLYHSVAQLLLMSNISRRYIHTELSYLTIIVKRTDEYDWGKLKRVMKYLKGTKCMKLILIVESLEVIRL